MHYLGVLLRYNKRPKIGIVGNDLAGQEYISIKAKCRKAIRLRGKYYKEDWDMVPEKSSSSHTIFKALQKAIDKAANTIKSLEFHFV